MFPSTRLRRNRSGPWIRNLVSETSISVRDLIYPIFIVDGQRKKEGIEGFDGVCRLSIDKVLEEVGMASELGIQAIILFPVVEDKYKDHIGSYATKETFFSKAISKIKSSFPDMGLIADVALDPYTLHGHDGVLKNSSVDGDSVDNDPTIEQLKKQALVLCKAGVDAVAPSDMMDGRVKCIRDHLDQQGMQDKLIISYAVKYASCLYGPFRKAVKSERKIDKSSYQLDLRNVKESMREIELDIAESADIIIIKPGMFYMDVLYRASSRFDIPCFAYQVSGEYYMLKHYAQSGMNSWSNVMMESLVSLKRAGARAIISYAALDAAKYLRTL
jgi:porphobilinogen synthase